MEWIPKHIEVKWLIQKKQSTKEYLQYAKFCEKVKKFLKNVLSPRTWGKKHQTGNPETDETDYLKRLGENRVKNKEEMGDTALSVYTYI